MECQNYCPENKPFVNNIVQSVIFSAEETALILEETPFTELPQVTIEKIMELGVEDDYNLIPRNLRVMISELNYHNKNGGTT